MPLRRGAALVVVVLLGAWFPALLVASPAPASAQRTLPGYVTMVSETGDWVGGGISRTYRGSFSFSVSDTSVHLAAGPFSFDFVAPSGRALTPSRYPGATRYPFQEVGEPGLSVSGDGRGCNELTGSFTVLDIAPDRLWIYYEQHCEGGDPAVFGEIRLGYGEATSPLGIEAAILAWPSEHPGVAVRPIPVRMTNNGSTPASVTSAVVAGGNDFTIVGNGCPVSLAPGATCTVHVGFTPSRAGVRLGLLTIADGRGNLREISLSGIGISGRTEWHMRGDPGDWIGGDRSYDYTPQMGARMGGGGTETYASMGVDHADDWWGATFEAPAGQILLPGHTYTGATRYPFNSGNAGMDVSGSGRGCNTLTGQFTVHEAAYADGYLTGFRISFEQHCEGGTPALRGEVSWRAFDPDAPTPDTTPPAPVTGLAAGPAGAAVELTWSNPTDADWVDTVILGASGTSAVTEGRLVYDGRRTSTVVTGFPTWLPYTLTVFTEDTSGNLSPVRTVTIPATTAPPTAPPAAPPTAPPPSPPSTSTSAPPAPAPPGSTAGTAPARTVALRATRLSRREVRFDGRAGTWAAGARAVLQRRTDAGWKKVTAKRFSPTGRVRWRLALDPRPRARFRLVARLDGQAVMSAPVRVTTTARAIR